MTLKRTLRIMGVDPGFAATGVALIDFGRRTRLVGHACIRTAKERPVARAVRLRVSVDDGRRTREVYQALTDLVQKHRPSVMCVEAYAPGIVGRQGGGAWKTSIVFGVAQAVAHQHDLLALTFLPADLRRHFGVRPGAPKDEVGREVARRVPGLQEALSDMPSSLREHVCDAAGHAVLGYTEASDIWTLTGRGTR